MKLESRQCGGRQCAGKSYNDYDDEQVKIRGDNVSLNLDLQDVAKLIRCLWAVSAGRACGRGEWSS